MSFPDFFAATLRILRHVVGVSAHVVRLVEFSSPAYDVHVTAELLQCFAQVRVASRWLGKISLQSSRYSARVSFDRFQCHAL